MQGKYAADIGDFMKLGLLRHLGRPVDAGGTGLRMGINWHLVPNEPGNNDGMVLEYLDPADKWHEPLRRCDPELMRCLIEVRHGQRSVAALERTGAVPLEWLTYRASLPLSIGASRESWHAGSLVALKDADLVFADPDNGVAVAPERRRAHKYALHSELADFARGGQALVVFQEHERWAKAEQVALFKLWELATAIGQEPVGVVRTHRKRCRFFLLTAPEQRRNLIAASLEGFVDVWAPHVSVIDPGADGIATA
jgi:hypothetical protein